MRPGFPTSPTWLPRLALFVSGLCYRCLRPPHRGLRVCRSAHAGFALDALEQALHDRRLVHRGGLVHHSDREANTSRSIYRAPGRSRIEPSVGSVGDSYDNALPRRSTASTRPRSSIGAGLGGRSKPSSSRRWNGWTGSTTAGSWSPSATFRRPKPRSATTPCWNTQPWRRDLNQTASGKPGRFTGRTYGRPGVTPVRVCLWLSKGYGSE